MTTPDSSKEEKDFDMRHYRLEHPSQSKKVKVIRIDNGKEIEMKGFYDEKGIMH